jgi:soluble lytic murein transglycosylase-like protein
VLHNGFTFRFVRQEDVGSSTRLWLCEGEGYIEIPSEQIERFEPIEPAAADTAPVIEGVTPEGRDPIRAVIAGAAARHQIDPDFVASVVKAESGFNPGAVSSKGAQGLMQLMPQTAASLGVGDTLNPANNVEGGTTYLRQLLDQYKGDAVKALAAYNAGPQRVAHFGGIPPYRETRAYITRVITDYNRKKLEQQAASGSSHP